MKKNYIYCILSLIIFIIGIISGFLYLIPLTDASSIKTILLLFFICFVLIGLSAFAVYYKRYMIIKSLDSDSSLAHWIFMPHTSTSLIHTLKEEKTNAICTFILSYILLLIFICTFVYAYLSNYFSALLLISLAILLIGLITINAYFTSFTKDPIHVIFNKELIYFLDDIYTFEKAMYQLDDVIIDTSDEPKLLFIYGQSEFSDYPYYVLEIPIPDTEISVAHHLRHYYLEEIKTLHEYS